MNFTLPREALTRGEHVLAVQVYSEEGVGGIVGPVLAGPLAALEARDARTSFLLVGTALLLIGISVNLLFYWGRRPENTEHLYLFVHVFALALLFLVWVPPFRIWLSEALDFYRLYLLLAGMAAAFFCFAFRRLLDLDRHRGVAGFGFLFAALGVVGLVTPGWSELRAIGMYLLDPALVVASLVVIVLAVQQLGRGVEDAKPLLWGIAFFVATLLHDVLGEWGWIVGRGMPWIYAGAVVFVLAVAWVTTRKIVDTATIALNDRLTGLYRREVVLDALKREIRRAARTHQPLALIMMDLDKFKTVNDSLGHQAGTACSRRWDAASPRQGARWTGCAATAARNSWRCWRARPKRARGWRPSGSAARWARSPSTPGGPRAASPSRRGSPSTTAVPNGRRSRRWWGRPTRRCTGRRRRAGTRSTPSRGARFRYGLHSRPGSYVSR